MTEANNGGWKCRGEKQDFRIEDLFVPSGVEDEVRFATEDMFEALCLGGLDLPMGMNIYRDSGTFASKLCVCISQALSIN